MDRPRLIRGLRIAWSVWWGILCVLLIGLWMRSYYVGDVVLWSVTKWSGFQFTSMEGELTGRRCSLDGAGHQGSMNFPNWLWQTTRDGMFGPTEHGFDFRRWFYIALPYWSPVVISAAFVAAPWLVGRGHRFTLRTLLIATTLIAVVLGLVVWSSS